MTEQFFSKPESALNDIIDKSLAMATPAEDLLDKLDEVKAEILKAINEHEWEKV